MKVNLIAVECGVRLLPQDEEYETYLRVGNRWSLYDEDIAVYIAEDIDKAREYALSYVQLGVPQTYAIMFKLGMVNIMEHEYEEITKRGFYEDVPTLLYEDIMETWYREKEGLETTHLTF